MTESFKGPSNLEELDYKIFFMRDRRVMLDRDLALLYRVPTKRLNEQVRRNISRFPEDFMFQLTKEEEEYISSRSQIVTLNNESALDKPNLKSQIVTSRSNNRPMRSQSVTASIRSQNATASKRNLRFLPYAFTEQGVAMLSFVLKSERAIMVNIQIMRTFTKIREMLASNKELRDKIEQLESKYDSQFAVVFKAIKQLLAKPENSDKNKIGFKTD